MSDENKLSVEITATIDSLTKTLTDGIKELEKFGEAATKEGAAGTKDLEDALKGLGQQLLGKISGALSKVSSQFKQTYDATKAATAGMKGFKASLIATGVGALVVAIGLLIEHWDDLEAALSPNVKRLKELNDEIEITASGISVLDAQVAALDAAIKLQEAQGLSAEGLKKDRKEILQTMLAELVVQRAATYEAMEAAKLKATELTLWEKILRARSGGFAPSTSQTTTDEQKEIDDYTKKTSQLDETIRKVMLTLGDFDNTLADKNPYEGLTKGTVAYMEVEKQQLLEAQKKTSKSTAMWEEYAGKIDAISKKITVLKQGIDRGAVDLIATVIPTMNADAEGYLGDLTQNLVGGLGVAKNQLLPIASEIEHGLATMTPTKDQLTLDAENYAAWAEQMKLTIEDLNADIQNLALSSLSGGITSVSSAIGEAIANGDNVLQAAGGALLASFASFLSDMGSMLIEYGVLAVAKGTIDSAIAAGGPIAIAAGIAAIAIGSALSIAGAALGSRAESFSGGDAAGAGDYSSSSGGSNYSSSAGTQAGGHFVFEIQGTKLIGVIRNTIARNRSMSGTVLSFD